jgi:transposase
LGLCGSRKFANHHRDFWYYSLRRFLCINGKADLLTVELGHTELPTQTPTRLEERELQTPTIRSTTAFADYAYFFHRYVALA